MKTTEQRLAVMDSQGASWLLAGDSEAGKDKANTASGVERSAAIPRLLSDGWRVVSITSMGATAAPSSFGLAVVLLQREQG